MNEVINAQIENLLNHFAFTDDKDVVPIEKRKTAQQKKEDFLKQLSSNLVDVSKQYQFQNGRELMTLLEGLADQESKGVTYWDYIEVDTLLSLQKTKTNFPDEVIFITYHQIHELYFKLIIQELEKIVRPHKFKDRFIEKNEVLRWNNGLRRSVRYLNKLIESFDILKYGLDRAEFGVFRKSLLPASGFQTHQFRLIEIMLTPFENLIKDDEKSKLPGPLSIDDHYNSIYWRCGVTDTTTGKPAKILVNFNNKYDQLFLDQLRVFSETNIYFQYLTSSKDFQMSVKEAMLELDQTFLMWKVAHLLTVEKHIPLDKVGTGGTNWAEYLPVKNQKINYFPEFWKEKDINNEIKKLREFYPENVKKEIQDIFRDDPA